jgi:zinc transport system substrate-binding protein
MSRLFTTVSAITLFTGTAALADAPKVVADIAPVHSLVFRVMDGIGKPDLIVPNETSPHDYRLRPADAEALENAGLVFWMGEGLTPWMERALDSLSGDATVIELLALDETNTLPFREGALFDAHDHDDHDDHDKEHDDHDDHDDHDKEHDDHDDHDDHDKEHDDHDDHDDHDKEHNDHDDHDDHDHDKEHDDHDDHDDHDHDKEHNDHDDHDDHDHDKEHDDHDDHDDHGHDDHAGHDHGEFDPHAWLSTDNARTWLNVIAAKLSSIDPANAGGYFSNASEAITELDALDNEVNEMLDPVRGGKFIVFHDAYQYFETVYDFPASGAISLGDASDPGAARIAEIANRIQSENIQCVLSEPQFNANMVDTVMAGTNAKTEVIDPLGFGIEPGVSLYTKLIKGMASSLVNCLR